MTHQYGIDMELSEELRDLLTEVFHIGVGTAAAGLSEMLNYRIEMRVPNLYFMNEDSLETYLKGLKGDYVCVTQRIFGDLEGVGSLSFPVVGGKTLIDNILGVKLDKPLFGAMEIEAIQEVGNIVINAVGGAFGNVIGLKVEFEVPTVSFLDYPLPHNLKKTAASQYYTISTASLGIKEINVEGFLNLAFAYGNIENFERFVRGGNLLSKKFGELLLAEGYITREQLDKAIAMQRDSRRFIGELMVARGYITNDQRNVILNSQKYTTYARKFGELVVERNLVTPDQLEALLNIQKHAGSFIGEILVYMGHLDPAIKESVLQKHYWKKNRQTQD
jgi:chemotaxis protein CheC